MVRQSDTLLPIPGLTALINRLATSVDPVDECLLPLLDCLKEIEALVGVTDFKQKVVDHVLAFAQRDTIETAGQGHFIISGPPGSGKTQVAYLLARLINRMGNIRSGSIVTGYRWNMIATSPGPTTTVLTQTLIDHSLGGALLLDNAWIIGDSLACVDVLHYNLVQKLSKFVCIVVGNTNDLARGFFGRDSRLESCFRWRIRLPVPTSSDLSAIFHSWITKWKLLLDDKQVGNESFFRGRIQYFPNYTVSVSELVDRLKLIYCRRVFGSELNKCITRTDLHKAIRQMQNVVPSILYT